MPKANSKNSKKQKSPIATPPMVPAMDKAFNMEKPKSKPTPKTKKGKC
jgi:hypothetical protein